MPIPLSFPLLTKSDACGRFDAPLLSTQAQLELMVTGFSDLVPCQDENEEFKEIESWPGLKCNADGLVTAIEWSFDACTSLMDADCISLTKVSRALPLFLFLHYKPLVLKAATFTFIFTSFNSHMKTIH